MKHFPPRNNEKKNEKSQILKTILKWKLNECKLPTYYLQIERRSLSPNTVKTEIPLFTFILVLMPH